MCISLPDFYSEDGGGDGDFIGYTLPINSNLQKLLTTAYTVKVVANSPKLRE